MNQSNDPIHYSSYLRGYRDGVRDTLNGKITSIPNDDLAALPLQARGLSTRATNCLHWAGCSCVADVAAPSGQTIARMRNMGMKTAAEIARWLHNHHIHCTEWEKYL